MDSVGATDSVRIDFGQFDLSPIHALPRQQELGTSNMHQSPASAGPRDATGEPLIIRDVFVHPWDRVVNRRLRGIHVFMITISAVLGVGLYVRSGTVLHIAGPAAVLIAFTVMGLLAWLVMQCIGEMLALWPISGALIEYVKVFVDEQLGTAIGIAYWFTYAINFAALIVAAAGILDFWDPGKAIQGTVMFFILPAFLILFNSFGVQIYGLTEVIGGTIKLTGAVVVIISMILINSGVGSADYIGTRLYRNGPMFPRDPNVSDSWVTALFISFSIAAFSFVGVEIATVPAFEARYDVDTQKHSGPWPRISVRFSATWTAFIAWVLYFLGGLMLTLNVPWDDPQLPGVSWLGSPTRKPHQTESGFVLSAAYSKIPGLADLFTAILLFTAVASANTNLYVASRTLFGMTRGLDGTKLKWLAFFGRTNNYQVPVRAMFVSCFFLWVPFLYLSPHNLPNTTIASLLEILSQMGSVSCLIVWTCETWAFIRFYNCMSKHQSELKQLPQFAHVCRFNRNETNDRYPWRSHGQPLTMYLALFGCFFTLIVVDGAALWNGFHDTAFLSAYLAPICFVVLWLALKIYSGSLCGPWQLEDLSNINVVKHKIKDLDELKYRASVTRGPEQPIGWGNLWGLM